MKGKTRRKIRRLWGILFGIYGSVFTIGSLIANFLILPLVRHIAKPIQSQVSLPSWIWLAIFWLIILVTLYLISKGLFNIYLKSLSFEINYFEEIDFGTPNKNTILKVIDGILNTEKVKPFYVHVAPKCKEVGTIFSRIKEIGFVMISGRPGEGKSMIAYHTAYRFQKENKYITYLLKVDQLENKTGKDIVNELLFQMDCLKGKKKLIIVDDAQKLSIKQDLNIILEQDAKEKLTKYIWVETEYHEENQKSNQFDRDIRIDFQPFSGLILRNFYKNTNPTIQKALKGRIKGLYFCWVFQNLFLQNN